MTRAPATPELRHHPSEEILALHTGGALPLGRRVMVESHLAFCPPCRAAVAELSLGGGRHLRALAAAEAPPAALWRKIAARVASEMAAPRDLLADTPLPAAARAELPALAEPLAWAGLGEAPARLARLWADPEGELELYLIENPPATAFPYHRHLGSEDLLVLEGGIEDAYGHYRAGDFQHYVRDTAHEPRIDAGATCWAITCVQGGVSFER